MPVVNYDPAAEGPSNASVYDLSKATNAVQSQFNTEDYSRNLFQMKNQFQNVSMPQLQSGLGANGQFGSSAGQKAIGQANEQEQFQETGLASQFYRAQSDLNRQQVFASIGLTI